MLGGAGLMFMQPVLPIFSEETLKLSYTELALAFAFCKGISFILSIPSVWGFLSSSVCQFIDFNFL